MRRQPFASFLSITATALSGLIPMAGQAENGSRIRVLDHIIVDEFKLDDEKVGEFSALVHDPATGHVLGVSDRGYVAVIRLDVSDDDLSDLNVAAIHVLSRADGAELRDSDFNPEGAALLPDGTLAIVDEAGPTLAIFDSTGVFLREELLPEGVRDAARQASDKDGVEALAWTDATGFVAMTEEPQQDQPRQIHTLYSVAGGQAALDLTGPENISIKGMDVSGDTLVILERMRDDTTDALRPYLRLVDLPACLAAGACDGQSLAFTVDGISDADFEGVAALGNGRFLVASDDEIDGDLRTVFALLQVE